MYSCRLGYALLAAAPFSSSGNLVEVLRLTSTLSDRSRAGVMHTFGHVKALHKPVVRHQPLRMCNGPKNQPTIYGVDTAYHDFHDVPRFP